MHTLKNLKEPFFLFKLTLFSGIIGSLIMLAGDMLMFKTFFNISGSEMLKTYFTKLAHVDNRSLFVGSYLGPLSLPFYLFGFYHFFLFFKKQTLFIGLSIYILFVFSICFNAFYHSTFANLAIASRLQQSFADNGQISNDAQQIINFSVYLFRFSDIGFKSGIALFIFSALIYKSNFNRFYFILSPLLLIYINIPLVKIIPAPIGGIIAGGYSNMVFFLYFLVSLFILPKKMKYDK